MTSHLDLRLGDVEFAQLLHGGAKCVRIGGELLIFLDEHMDQHGSEYRVAVGLGCLHLPDLEASSPPPRLRRNAQFYLRCRPHSLLALQWREIAGIHRARYVSLPAMVK